MTFIHLRRCPTTHQDTRLTQTNEVIPIQDEIPAGPAITP